MQKSETRMKKAQEKISYGALLLTIAITYVLAFVFVAPYA
jgi:hypothetical protein